MAYEDIEQHLGKLGIAPLSGPAHVPVDDEFWNELAPRTAKHVPEALRWFFKRFGGSRFPEGAFFHDPRYDQDVMVGWFLDEDELRDAFEATRGALPDDVVPIANDGGDNYLATGIGANNSGVIYFNVHDAPAGANLYVVGNTIDDFLRSLHPES